MACGKARSLLGYVPPRRRVSETLLEMKRLQTLWFDDVAKTTVRPQEQRAEMNSVLSLQVDNWGWSSGARPAGQATEAVLACKILNRMTELGRPESYRIRG